MLSADRRGQPVGELLKPPQVGQSPVKEQLVALLGEVARRAGAEYFKELLTADDRPEMVVALSENGSNSQEDGQESSVDSGGDGGQTYFFLRYDPAKKLFDDIMCHHGYSWEKRLVPGINLEYIPLPSNSVCLERLILAAMQGVLLTDKNQRVGIFARAKNRLTLSDYHPTPWLCSLSERVEKFAEVVEADNPSFNNEDHNQLYQGFMKIEDQLDQAIPSIQVELSNSILLRIVVYGSIFPNPFDDDDKPRMLAAVDHAVKFLRERNEAVAEIRRLSRRSDAEEPNRAQQLAERFISRRMPIDYREKLDFLDQLQLRNDALREILEYLRETATYPNGWPTTE
jgi:hypothetical protein